MFPARPTSTLPGLSDPGQRQRGFCNEMLFDRQLAESFYGVAPEAAGRWYDDDRGLVVRSQIDGVPFRQDLIRFEPDAMAFTGSSTPRPLRNTGHHLQTLEGGDWLHFCLRLGGEGVERITDHASVSQPSRSCVVTRYPGSARIERISQPDADWRTACLWLRPGAVLRFLETSAARVPAELRWLVDPGHSDQARHVEMALHPRMVSAVSEVLDCAFTGGTRRAFVRSRYLEMLALIYQGALERVETEGDLGVNLSSATTDAVARAADLLAARLDCMGSLAEIAREVGLSRTRLTQGFRACMGTSVEAWWQARRMERARQLICDQGASVKDVAQHLGYAELASFSRAFARAHGSSPTHLRAALR